MVVKQYRAKGTLTDILLPIVALDDAVGLMIFAVSFGVSRSLGAGNADLVSVLERHSNSLKIVFRGKREIFTSKLSEKLISFYENKHSDLEERIKIAYAIGGFVHVANDHLFANKQCDVEMLSRYSENMIKSIAK